MAIWDMDEASRQQLMLSLGGRLLANSQYIPGQQSPWVGLGQAMVGGAGDIASIRSQAMNNKLAQQTFERNQMVMDQARQDAAQAQQSQETYGKIYEDYLGGPYLAPPPVPPVSGDAYMPGMGLMEPGQNDMEGFKQATMQQMLRDASLGGNPQAAMSLLSGPQREFKNVIIDDMGRAYGVNAAGQYQQIPMAQGTPSPINYKTVQGADEQGIPVTELVNPAAMQESNGRLTIGIKPAKALPAGAGETVIQGIQAIKALDQLQQNISESGLIKGRISQVEAALGTNQKAIEFETARNNFKLSAQAMIKGTPSNFDVQTVIDTLPALGLPEVVNESRVKYSREVMKSIIEGTASYYKGIGYNIPDTIINAAQQYKIDIAGVKPWNGKGDPITPPDNKLNTPPPPAGFRIVQ